MATRRPHRKSRLGCLTCKQRRVKCDEAGPPCGPCRARCIPCEYADTKHPRKSPAESTGTSDDSSKPDKIDAANSIEARRLLELELLHQWSTVTYQNYCSSVVDEYWNWQVLVPRLAMQHQCLLHAMLAMSALEIAAFSTDDMCVCDHYVDIALKYHNLASSGLRSELSHVHSGNRQATFAASSILMVLGLALPHFASRRGEAGSYLDHFVTFLALLKGFQLILESDENFRHSDPLVANHPDWETLPVTKVEPELELALQSIAGLNDEMYGATGSPNVLPDEIATAHHAANKRALYYLRAEFQRCNNPDTRAYALGWPLRAGPAYTAGIASHEPIALVILMFWAVLMHELGHKVWWMEGVGSRLVADLSVTIDPSLYDRLNDVIAWAHSQVGLERPTSMRTELSQSPMSF